MRGLFRPPLFGLLILSSFFQTTCHRCVERYRQRTRDINGVSFHSAKVGYFAGSYGFVHGRTRGWLSVTADGGKTWRRQFSVPQVLRAVAALDENTAVAIGTNRIMRTADQGKHWRPVFTGDAQLLALCFADARTGLALGNSRALRTEDGGLTWRDVAHPQADRGRQHRPLPPESPRTCHLFAGGRRAFATYWSPSSTLFKTDDGGRRWAVVPIFKVGEPIINDMFFLPDGQRGWLAVWREVGARKRAGFETYEYLVLATKDGGRSWVSTPLPGFEIRAIAFAPDGKRGWIADSLGKLQQTEDGGRTWRALSAPAIHKSGHGSVLKILLLPDHRTLLVTFRGGIVVKGRPSSTSWRRMRP